MMAILIPFKALKLRFPELANGFSEPYRANGVLLELIKVMLCSVEVDDKWYREKYPDVACAIDAGDYDSAQRHFVDHGYFEGRLPCALKVDESWYLEAYDDIANAIEDGDIPSAEEHFNQFGYAEGRLPVKVPALI